MLEPILIGASLFLLVAFLTISYLRGRHIRVRSEEAIRKRIRASEWEAEADERRQQQYVAIRKEARARARISFPDLLDAEEANGVGDGSSTDGINVDADLIREAQALVDAEIAELKKESEARDRANPSRDILTQLQYEARVLECVHEDSPTFSKPTAYLDDPARIIDCGEAGRVELYTAVQVEAAREQSGYRDYVRFVEDRAEAPQLAARILAHAKERDDALERERLKAQAAITTKLDELPPLPREIKD